MKRVSVSVGICSSSTSVAVALCDPSTEVTVVTDFDGESPPSVYIPSLDFSDARNSQYIALF